MRNWILLAVVAIASAATIFATPVEAADDCFAKMKFESAQDAYGVGVALLNAKKRTEARGPLETALTMAADDKYRLRVYETLLPTYRQLPEFEPFRDASEFIIRHLPHDAGRSLTRGSLLSFAYNRGKIQELTKRYEDALKKTPDDKPTIYILAELYARYVEEPKRAIELMEQLAKLEQAGKVPVLDANAAMTIVYEKAELARQYTRAREYEKAATLYEQIAPLDERTSAWNLKEAASAWLKLGNKTKALELAEKAEAAPPDGRGDQFSHSLHRNLGDIFIALDQPAKAIPHYEIAVTKTKIEGYLKDTKYSLEKAKQTVHEQADNERAD